MKAPNYVKDEKKTFEMSRSNACTQQSFTIPETVWAKHSNYSCSSSNSAVGANGLRRPNVLSLDREVWEIQKPLTYTESEWCYLFNNATNSWYAITKGVRTQRIREQHIYAIGHIVPRSVAQKTIDLAVSKFYADVSDIKFNYAVFAMELAKTRDMVAARAWQIGRSYKLLRQGKIKQAIAQFTTLKQNKVPIKGDKPLKGKDLADAWLELRYGWTPLMYEVQGAIELLEEKILGGKLAMSYRKSTKVSYTDNSTVRVSGIDFAHNATMNDHVTISCLIKPDCPTRIILSQLGFDNPALIAYELMPYSFVVDWFYNIGDYLQSQTALAGLSVDYFSITKTRYIQDEITVSQNDPSYPGSEPSSPGKHTYFSKRKRRDLGIPLPPMPTLGVNMDWKRLLDSLAMMKQQSGKFGK